MPFRLFSTNHFIPPLSCTSEESSYLMDQNIWKLEIDKSILHQALFIKYNVNFVKLCFQNNSKIVGFKVCLNRCLPDPN